MTDTDASLAQTAEKIGQLLARFEQENPEVAEALRIMNISFEQYLLARAAMQGQDSISGNATIV